MNPYKHSEISVRKRGGTIEDYYEIHKLIDSTKEVCSDNRHRLFHTHWGINRIIEPIVGETIVNSDGKVIVIKDLCESDHILPDYKNKFIPTLSDFVDCIDDDAIKNWEKKIESIHKKYSGNKELEELLLSPLVNTGRMKSLLLTHNSWFIHRILKMIHPVEIELIDYELGIQEVFNNMRFELWMDNGTGLPDSAKKEYSKIKLLKMNKTYVIRKIAYHYSDDHLYVHTIGGIENTFQSEDEAKTEFLRLEREALESCDLGDTAQLSGCDNNYLKEAMAFKRYYKQKFGEDIVKVNEYGTIFCERGTTIPKGLSDDDIIYIRKILDLKFYELSSFEGNPIFYGIWLNETNSFQEYCGAPYFFSTYSEALKKAKGNLNFMRKTLKGTFEELSNNPTFLKSLVNSSDKIEYDEDKKELTTKYPSKDESIALNELLKEKVFEIKEIPISMVENIEHWTYEEM